jgi:hypothetical protein
MRTNLPRPDDRSTPTTPTEVETVDAGATEGCSWNAAVVVTGAGATHVAGQIHAPPYDLYARRPAGSDAWEVEERLGQGDPSAIDADAAGAVYVLLGQGLERRAVAGKWSAIDLPALYAHRIFAIDVDAAAVLHAGLAGGWHLLSAFGEPWTADRIDPDADPYPDSGELTMVALGPDALHAVIAAPFGLRYARRLGCP